MNIRRRLYISISTGESIHGLMYINTAIELLSKQYPDFSTTISIVEEMEDKSLVELCRRENGEWLNINIPNNFSCAE